MCIRDRDTIAEAENERNKLSTLFLHMTDGVVAFNAPECTACML